MSDDHKPQCSEEFNRINQGGGFVFQNRVNGELAMSRAFGDFQYKSNQSLSVFEQLVIAVPDITVHKRSKHDEWMILACDGVWDVMSCDEALEFVDSCSCDNVVEKAAALISLSLNIGSTDNLSAIVIRWS